MVLARKSSVQGQFNAQEDRNWINYTIHQQVRGFGWSRETILQRMGITDGDRELLDIPIFSVEGIFIFGHGVHTRASNICKRCDRTIAAGEIVLGVVTGGYGTGGTERNYICSECLLQVEGNADITRIGGFRLMELRKQVEEYNKHNGK
jgi:hypothetical protein